MEPLIRASYAHILLTQVEVLPQRGRIHARIGADLLARVKATHAVAFLDGHDYMALVTAAQAELDDATYFDLLRKQTNRFGETPFIAPTIRGLVRLMGSSPHALLRHLPRLRDATVRGFGVLAYERKADKDASFTLRGYPARYMTAANQVIFLATFVGTLDIAGHKGEVVITRQDDALGDVDYAVTW